MTYAKILLTSLLLIAMTQLIAQSLSDHQWKDRLLVILVDDPELPRLQQQLKTFRAEKVGMEERKLVVYQATPHHYRTGLETDGEWQQAAGLYTRYKTTDAPFEILLIGLDGGVKLRQTEHLSVEDLFARIDGMPMRRAEMRRKQE